MEHDLSNYTRQHTSIKQYSQDNTNVQHSTLTARTSAKSTTKSVSYSIKTVGL